MKKNIIGIAGIACIYILFLYYVFALDIYEVRHGRFSTVVGSSLNAWIVLTAAILIGLGFLSFRSKRLKNTGIALIVINVIIDIFFYGRSIV